MRECLLYQEFKTLCDPCPDHLLAQGGRDRHRFEPRDDEERHGQILVQGSWLAGGLGCRSCDHFVSPLALNHFGQSRANLMLRIVSHGTSLGNSASLVDPNHPSSSGSIVSLVTGGKSIPCLGNGPARRETRPDEDDERGGAADGGEEEEA